VSWLGTASLQVMLLSLWWRVECIWRVGGGWHQPPSDLSTAGVLGITVLIFAVILCLISTTYCCIRRPRILRRRGNGGRASDYVRQCDVAAQIPSPPAYDDHTIPLPSPPPYSEVDSTDKPPDYEVVLLTNGQCVYRPRSRTAEDRHVSCHSESSIWPGGVSATTDKCCCTSENVKVH